MILPSESRVDPDAPALIAAEGDLTHGALRRKVDGILNIFPDQKSLILIQIENSLASVLAYVAALEAGHAVLPVDPSLAPDRVEQLVAAYAPEVILNAASEDPKTWMKTSSSPADRAPLHEDLSLLLLTSGSTGSPKAVRLSRAAVAANCRGIVSALAIAPTSRAAGHLPLSYSYGLSVLHSHLQAGAAVVLAPGGLLDRAFWPLMARAAVDTFPGVPYHYAMLNRLNLDRLGVPALRHFTQAGGAMATADLRRWAGIAAARGGSFTVMYGQTEAAPRMTVLDPAEADDHPGSVGKPLPGGSIAIVDARGAPVPVGETGEVLYRGPNVMMGRAASRADLAHGDSQGGVLATGDLGHLDAEGFLFLTGRKGNFVKICGLRVNLQAVEDAAGAHGAVAARQSGDHLILWTEAPGDDTRQAMKVAVAAETGLPAAFIQCRFCAALPRHSNGKLNRAGLPL